jgi:hypothetical protein
MTSAEEAEFIALWEQGATYRELAAALRCPLGTVASRAAALVAQGRITPQAAQGRLSQPTRSGPAGGRTCTSAETSAVHRHRCRSRHGPRIPPVNPCAGTCGSWMRFATNLPH